jgi:hypothetical protein
VTIRCKNWLKTQPKNFFSLTELKKKLMKRWSQCVEVGVGGGGVITLKSKIGFVSVYLK